MDEQYPLDDDLTYQEDGIDQEGVFDGDASLAQLNNSQYIAYDAYGAGLYQSQSFMQQQQQQQDHAPDFNAQQTFANNAQAFPPAQSFPSSHSSFSSQFSANNATLVQAALPAIHHELAPSHRLVVASPPRPASMDDSIDSSESTTSDGQPVQVPASAKTSGPMSKIVHIPARPKPGRKPMPPGEASDRRRTQNRMAQRNFRDKRQQKVCELNEEIRGLSTELRERLAELHRVQLSYSQKEQEMMSQHQSEKEKLHAQIYELQQQLAASQGNAMGIQGLPGTQGNVEYPRFPGPKLPAISTQPIEKAQEVAIPTPPEDNWNEMDMSEVWTRSKPSNHQQHDSGNWTSYEMDTDPIGGLGCGFCTDDSNCACKAPATPAAKQTSSGPGTCDMCQRDPARAAACRSLADKTQPSLGPTPTAPSTKTMSCGDFIDKYKSNNGRMPGIAELFGPLHSFPARNGFNVDEQDAAKALQDMSMMDPASRS